MGEQLDHVIESLGLLDDAERDRLASVIDRVFETLTMEFVHRMDAINDDPESSHIDADHVLLDLARTFAPRVADAYERAEKRCGAWWYA